MSEEDDREWLSGLKWAALALSFGFVGWMVRGEGKLPRDYDDRPEAFRFLTGRTPLAGDGLWRVDPRSGDAWFVMLRDEPLDGKTYRLPVWYRVKEQTDDPREP